MPSSLEYNSNQIRQRLLENKTLDLKAMFDQARALDSAMRSSESYSVPQPVTTAATASEIVYQIPHLQLLIQSVSSVEILNTLVLSVRLKTPFVINAKKGDTLLKFVEERPLNSTKS